MICSLGIDTSNYTTSAALYSDTDGIVANSRRILTVKSGEVGLRQSDAVFQHTVSFSEVFSALPAEYLRKVGRIGVSVSPRDEAGSYMPCFMVGKNIAGTLAHQLDVPLFAFSHQSGHIAAAAYSAGRADLLQKEFIAFHVSGGTTEAVLVSPDSARIFRVSLLASSLDLKAGQAVDRVGHILGLPFPAGPSLENLAVQSEKTYKPKPFMRDGCPSLSGLENRCARMKQDGIAPCDIAKYCLDYIAEALIRMTAQCTERYPGVTVLYAGGVMSDLIIREKLSLRFDAVFSAPEYSSDNAVGIAYLTSLL